LREHADGGSVMVLIIVAIKVIHLDNGSQSGDRHRKRSRPNRRRPHFQSRPGSNGDQRFDS